MALVGGKLIRKRLAYLEQDTTNNTVTFTFEDGIHNLDVYPGKNLPLDHHEYRLM
jgi:hypothetical protein